MRKTSAFAWLSIIFLTWQAGCICDLPADKLTLVYIAAGHK